MLGADLKNPPETKQRFSKSPEPEQCQGAAEPALGLLIVISEGPLHDDLGCPILFPLIVVATFRGPVRGHLGSQHELKYIECLLASRE